MKDSPKVGVGVLIFNNEGEILLGKRLTSHGTQSWAPPGGHLEFGESFEACAIRETFEETGLNIQSPTIISFSNDYFDEVHKHYISFFMKAHFPVGQNIHHREPHKTTPWQWFALDNLPENLFLPLRKLVKNKCHVLEPLPVFN